MIKTPVISALGKKIGLANDQVLSQIVGLIDEGKTVDEIVASVNGVTTEQAQAVKDARNIFYQGEGSGIIVNAYSPKVDIAKLFLRFIASDDAAKLMYEYANAVSSYKSTEDIGYQNSDSEFLKSTYEIVNSEEGVSVCRKWGGMRKELNLINWTNTNVELEKILASAKGKLTGTKVMDQELEYMKKTWTERYAEYKK
jgi:ABC-type glycerol-3-phosphate transport system substrate-binding protein